MSWLFFTILAYFLLAIISLSDRYFLVGLIPNPKVYTFNIGILGLLVGFLIIPLGLHIPEINIILLGLGAGLVRIIAVFFLNKGIFQSEASRVVPAVGGLLPIFSFLIFLIFFPKTEILNLSQIIAFLLLLIGSVLISFEIFQKKFFKIKNLTYPIIAALLFALTFFLIKTLFLKTEFFNGLFLMLLGGGLGVLSFLFFPQVRKDIFSQKISKKISILFPLAETIGGLGVLSQYYAVFLVRPGQVPLINALEGTRYIFLLLFIYFISRWRPSLLKEKMKGKILFQKIFATLLIIVGLAILAF
jgi:hypothetical protein